MKIWDSIAADLLEAAYGEAGGMTIEPLTGHVPTDGYMVGGMTDSLRLTPEWWGRPYSEMVETVSEWLAAHYSVAWSRFGRGVYVGSWRDVETGVIWIDLSERRVDEVAAARIAKVRGELAYYAVTRGESVYV